MYSTFFLYILHAHITLSNKNSKKINFIENLSREKVDFDLSKPAIIKPKYSIFWSFTFGGGQLLVIAFFVNTMVDKHYSLSGFAVVLTPLLLLFIAFVVYESFKTRNGYKLFIISDKEVIAQKRKDMTIIIPLCDIEFRGRSIHKNPIKEERFLEYIEANNKKIDMRRIKNRNEIAETITLYQKIYCE